MIKGSLNPEQIATLQRRLDGAVLKARMAVRDGVTFNALQLARYVANDKLNGQVLNVRTGLLRKSLEPPLFEHREFESTGIVGSTMPNYGKVLEVGFQGTVQRMMRKAWGRPVKDPRMIAVNMDIKPRKFLKSSVAEKRDSIVQDIRRRVFEAAQ